LGTLNSISFAEQGEQQEKARKKKKKVTAKLCGDFSEFMLNNV